MTTPVANSSSSQPNASGRTKAEEITATLRDEILSGQYRPGERMPSERDLAARFEANRGAIRESLKKLEQLGIASITPGGVRVVPVKEASLSVLGPLIDLQESPDPAMAGNLLEVLGALISMAARTATERATDQELEQMQTIVSDLLDNADDTEYQHERWRDLGELFTEVSENLVLRLILNGLKTEVFNRANERPQLELEMNHTSRKQVLTKLAAAMQNRDAQQVASAILEHFDLINQTLQLAFKQVLSSTQQGSSL